VVDEFRVQTIISQQRLFEFLWKVFAPFQDMSKVRKYLDSSLSDLQLVQSNVVAVTDDATVRDALSLMTDHQVGAVVGSFIRMECRHGMACHVMALGVPGLCF
jgi:hypothetical protein